MHFQFSEIIINQHICNRFYQQLRLSSTHFFFFENFEKIVLKMLTYQYLCCQWADSRFSGGGFHNLANFP